jgi:Ni,Fe-hydrogenase III large subunit
MRGKSIAVVLRQVCSKSGLAVGARHTYLVHEEVLVEVVEKLLGGRCCYSTGAGAGVDFVVDFAGNVVAGVDG